MGEGHAPRHAWEALPHLWGSLNPQDALPGLQQGGVGGYRGACSVSATCFPLQQHLTYGVCTDADENSDSSLILKKKKKAVDPVWPWLSSLNALLFSKMSVLSPAST